MTFIVRLDSCRIGNYSAMHRNASQRAQSAIEPDSTPAWRRFLLSADPVMRHDLQFTLRRTPNTSGYRTNLSIFKGLRGMIDAGVAEV